MFFFFSSRRRHTRLQGDWSSDVCSSDLSIVALRDIPVVNAEIRGDDIVYRKFVHLGVAVGTERGLVVPVLHHAERMSFADIEREIARLAGPARGGKLKLDDLARRTVTLSHGGGFRSP